MTARDKIYCEAISSKSRYMLKAPTVRTVRECVDNQMVPVLQSMKADLRARGYTDIRTYWQYKDLVDNNPVIDRHEVIIC